MKDYSGLFEIAEASAAANNDEKLHTMIEELKSMIELNLEYAQQDVADRMGERILELLQEQGAGCMKVWSAFSMSE